HNAIAQASLRFTPAQSWRSRCRCIFAWALPRSAIRRRSSASTMLSTPRRSDAMPLLAISFPAFDPIAVSIGPLAIRWYALAYIGGILLGWVYARGILKSERAWGGPAPISLAAFDDFVLWITLGIILGG